MSKLPQGERIPVHAWIGPPAEQTTLERYKELADAGFTSSFSFLPNADAVAKALDVAKEAGVKLIICCPELEKDPEGIVKRFQNHPALEAYHLRDEPSANDFAALAKWVKRIQAVDKEHWSYINLFPTYASAGQLGSKNYQEHVDRFVAEVPVEKLSYDNYPITGNTLRDDYYENMEIISKASRSSKKPFWAFTLAVAHGSYPKPEISHIRLQIFSDLAYGAAGVQYFTYWTPVDPNWKFNNAPIEVDGKRTPVYDLAKTVNQEVRGLSCVFSGSKVESIGHTGKLPRGTQAYKAAAPISEVTTGGHGAVVSLLSKEKRNFLVVVNRDFNAEMPLTVVLDGSVAVQSVDKEGGLHAVADKKYAANVGKGDIAILTWERK